MVQPVQLLPERRDGGRLLPSRGRLAPRWSGRSGGGRDGGRLHLHRPQPDLPGRRTVAGARTLARGLGLAVAPTAGRRPDHRLDGRPDARAHAGGGALDGPGHGRASIAGTNGAFRARPAPPASSPPGEGPCRLGAIWLIYRAPLASISSPCWPRRRSPPSSASSSPLRVSSSPRLH